MTVHSIPQNSTARKVTVKGLSALIGGVYYYRNREEEREEEEEEEAQDGIREAHYAHALTIVSS